MRRRRKLTEYVTGEVESPCGCVEVPNMVDLASAVRFQAPDRVLVVGLVKGEPSNLPPPIDWGADAAPSERHCRARLRAHSGSK